MATVNNSFHPLSILLWNANGILKNINELQFTLNENKIDIAMISETHLTHKNFLNLNGYESLRADHPDGTAHGGSALLISHKIPHSPFPSHTSDNIQIIASSIILNSIPISFASAYLPPGCQFPDTELSQKYTPSITHSSLEQTSTPSTLIGVPDLLTQEAAPF